MVGFFSPPGCGTESDVSAGTCLNYAQWIRMERDPNPPIEFTVIFPCTGGYLIYFLDDVEFICILILIAYVVSRHFRLEHMVSNEPGN
jgi:hypothetical protein